MASGFGDVPFASREIGDGLRIAFASPTALQGPGDLLHIVTSETPTPINSVTGHFNGGSLATNYTALMEPGISQTPVQPLVFGLHPNFPNPFNAETRIRFDLPATAATRLVIFNALGQRVRTMFDEVAQPGRHAITWDGRDERGAPLATGTYLYLLTSGSQAESRALLLVK